VNQTTISRSSEWVKGLQLDQNVFSGVKFHPAPADNGLVFIRSDLPGEPHVKCCLENLRKQPRWTSLAEDNVWIHHTEHLLAAVAGAGIDNVVIEVNTDRIPIVSAGSCADFHEALLKAGIKNQNVPRQVFVLKKPIHLEAKLSTPSNQVEITSADMKRYILGTPGDSFSVSYVFHVPHINKMRIGFAEYYSTLNSFEENLSKARSYFLMCELEDISTLLSATHQDFIVLTEQSPNSMVHEVARHKILDFIGDLMVLGRPITGRFIAVRSGHQHHHDFVRELMDDGCLELQTIG